MILNYNNTHIYYEIQGKGPALVLLHGFLESITMWEPLIPKTIENKTVITIDLPCHGKSGCIGKVHSMELMAEVVHYILKYHTIKSATFMGHSMGGYVALAYAEMYDAEVNTLILLNSTPAEDFMTQTVVKWLRILKFYTDLRANFSSFFCRTWII